MLVFLPPPIPQLQNNYPLHWQPVWAIPPRWEWPEQAPHHRQQSPLLLLLHLSFWAWVRKNLSFCTSGCWTFITVHKSVITWTGNLAVILIEFPTCQLASAIKTVHGDECSPLLCPLLHLILFQAHQYCIVYHPETWMLLTSTSLYR